MRTRRTSLLGLMIGVFVAAGAAVGMGLGITSRAAGRPATRATARRASASAASGTSALTTLTVPAGGLVRTYLLYVPPGDSARHRLPLVLVYHGAYDTAADIANESGLLALAERRQNMIVAFCRVMRTVGMMMLVIRRRRRMMSTTLRLRRLCWLRSSPVILLICGVLSRPGSLMARFLWSCLVVGRRLI